GNGAQGAGGDWAPQRGRSRHHPDALCRATVQPGGRAGAGAGRGRGVDALPASGAAAASALALSGRRFLLMSSPPQTGADRAQRLAGLLEALTERKRRGEPVEVEQAARENPDLADELRQLWAAVQVVGTFARAVPSRPTSDRPTHLPSTLGSPTDAVPFSPPPRRFGNYELLSELGRGGMGVVYKARQLGLDRLVALKVLRNSDADEGEAQRFRHEAEMAARLDHPNIVPVYDVGEVEGQPYFTMKYIEGTTLAHLIDEGPLPPREAAACVAVIAGAIDHAHQKGVLHRDLKPSNILLSRAVGQSVSRSVGE